MNKRQIISVGFILIVLAYVVFHIGTIYNSIASALHILTPIVTGAILAYALNLPVRFLENKAFGFLQKFKVSKTIVRHLSILVVFLSIAGVAALLINILLPQLILLVSQTIVRLPGALRALDSFLQGLGIHIGEQLNFNLGIDGSNPQQVENLLGNAGRILFGGLMQGSTVISSVFSSILGSFFTFMFVYYAIASKEQLSTLLKKLLYTFCKEKTADAVAYYFKRAHKTFSTFIRGQSIQALILGGLVFIGTLLARIPNALLISILVTVFSFIPIIGAWISGALGFLLVLTVDVKLALWFVAVYLLMQAIQDNVLYPKLMGKTIGLPPVWVLIAVIIGQSFFGVFGALLFIPFTSLLYTLAEEYSTQKMKEKNIAPEKVEP